MEEAVLGELESGLIENSLEFAKAKGFDHSELVGVINSLGADEFVVTETMKKQERVLTEEGEAYLNQGSPEAQVFYLVKEAGPLAQQEIVSRLPQVGKIGFAKCMQNKWISMDKATKQVSASAEEITDQTKELLRSIASSEEYKENEFKEMKKRKLVKEVERAYFKVQKGPDYAPVRVKASADVTAEMLASGSWKTTQFKEYNFNAQGKLPEGGHLHPLLKVRAQMRTILLDMGFQEMPTNNWVESAFWNFDTLFQPQSHPARDAHDTFFVKNPQLSENFPSEYCESVKEMHEVGGCDSIGWRYNWSKEEACKNLLRTHTTAVSSRMLYQLAQEGFEPKKYFSIDRVFRNENLDQTHLAEFHQIEGLIADKGLGLADLMGVISEFFRRLGITNLKFKPAYNPYTEPSMEIFGYHPILKSWTEIGNSGVFRPEMLRPMGLPEDVSVIAWGLSLERPTMIQYNIKNIRDLFGHKIGIDDIRDNPICVFTEG